MKRILAVGVLALCLMTSHIARADEKRDAQIKAEMVQNYLLWQEAWKLKDAGRFISFESPDFTRVLESGNVLNKQLSDLSWRDTLSSIQKVYNARVEIKKVTIEPNRIVILNTFYLNLDSRDVSMKQSERISATFRLRDIWVNYDRVWMLKRTEHLSSQIFIDGKLQNSENRTVYH